MNNTPTYHNLYLGSKPPRPDMKKIEREARKEYLIEKTTSQLMLEDIPISFTLRKYKYQDKWAYDIEINGGRGCFSGSSISEAISSLKTHIIY